MLELIIHMLDIWGDITVSTKWIPDGAGGMTPIIYGSFQDAYGDYVEGNGDLVAQLGDGGTNLVPGSGSKSIPAMQNDKDGPGWEAVVGAAIATGSEMFYSKTYKTWMGKNFKLYQQTWGGNGYTGGKNKFGKSTSNWIKWGGRALGVWNAYSVGEKYGDDEIGTGWMVAEQLTNAFSAWGTLPGAAWGVGWETGRWISTMDAYQEFKFNFAYDSWESKVGSPSQSNEGAWYYFYQNYKP